MQPETVLWLSMCYHLLSNLGDFPELVFFCSLTVLFSKASPTAAGQNAHLTAYSSATSIGSQELSSTEASCGSVSRRSGPMGEVGSL